MTRSPYEHGLGRPQKLKPKKPPPLKAPKPPKVVKPPKVPKPKAPSLPGYDDLAKSQLAGVYDPVLGQYAQIIQQQTESAAQAKAKADAFKAFAEWYGAHGPQQVQGIYDTAAGNQTAFAKGFSSAFTHAMQQLAEGSNQQIAIAGGPAAQQIHVGPESGGDAIYGMGAIPGGMLNQQGAAFAAAAALQPPAIFAEGQRQAGEITAAANKDIEALRLEETKIRSQYAADVQKQADSLRAEGEKAKAKALENLQKRADKRTDQTGTIWVVKGNRIVDTRRPTLAGLKYEQGVKMDLASLKKDADTSARLWQSLDWRMKQDLIKNRQAGVRIWQAQKRLGMTAQNQSYNQWVAGERLRIAQEKAAGTGASKPLGTPSQLSAWRANARATTRKARRAGASLEEIVAALETDPDAGPRAVWGPIVANNSGLSTNLPQNIDTFPAIRIVQLANKFGFGGPLLGDRALNPATVAAAKKFLLKQYSIWQGLLPKADAASYGGGQQGYLASLWIQAGGDPSVAATAAAIAMGESGGRNDARLVSSVEDSRGLWQINTRAHPWAKNLNDPLSNARAAVRIYKDNGGFGPWSVYTSGKYKQYLNAGSQNVSYKGGGGAIHEMFYDPIGAYDEGSWIAPIGGHSDHVHISFGDANEALSIMAMAQRFGLRVGENPYNGSVTSGVHVSDSYHYRTFPGSYNGRQLGMAADFSGSAAAMARFFRWVRSRYLGSPGRGSV